LLLTESLFVSTLLLPFTAASRATLVPKDANTKDGLSLATPCFLVAAINSSPGRREQRAPAVVPAVSF
jgi:hypothetical protein